MLATVTTGDAATKDQRDYGVIKKAAGSVSDYIATEAHLDLQSVRVY
jgi:hypothetical protein